MVPATLINFSKTHYFHFTRKTAIICSCSEEHTAVSHNKWSNGITGIYNHVWRLLHEINLTKINRVGTRSGGDMGETMNSSVTNIRQGETVNCNIEVKGIKVEKNSF